MAGSIDVDAQMDSVAGMATLFSARAGSDVFTYSVGDNSGTADTGFVTLTTTASPAPDGIVEGHLWR